MSPSTTSPRTGGESALEALVDAAAGILAADSLKETLGRIAHHLAAVVHYDDLSVYEVAADGTALRPVFAAGNRIEAIMADHELSVDAGVTGWVVRNRRTRNVRNTLLEPLCTVIAGTGAEVERARVVVMQIGATVARLGAR